MKFDKKIATLFKLCVILLFVVQNISALRKNRLFMTFRDEPASVFINRGFSYFNNEKDIYKDVEKLAMKKKIFNFDIDVAKEYYGDFYVSAENLRSALNRNVTNFSTDEMRKNSEVTLKGDYRVTIDSDVYKYANSHILRKVIMSHVFSDTVGKVSLSLNHNKNFPNFDIQFVEEAYQTFYKSPNSNEESHTIKDLIYDKETIKSAIKFFSEYGTHYFSDIILGYRYGFYQEYKNKTTILRDKDGKVPVPDLTKFSFLELEKQDPLGGTEPSLPLEKNPTIISGSMPGSDLPPTPEPQTSAPAPVKAGTDLQPESNQFYIGECTIEKSFIKSETCNKTNPRPVRYSIHPVHYLFNPLLQNKKDFSADGENLDDEKMKKIHSNMAYLYDRIQGAMDPNLFVVTKIESFKLAKADAHKSQPCLSIKHKTLEKIYKSYTQTKKGKFYQEDIFINNKHIPVTSFKNYNKLKKAYHIITNGGDGLYWCLTREHNVTTDELKSGKWESKKFLMDIKVIIDHDNKPFTEAGYQCAETWAFTDKKTKNENRWHFCTKWTENFMDSRIVTDVKFFEFHRAVGKCTNGYLQTYLDGKRYECDCSFNYRKISDEKKQGNTYLCMSRKEDVFKKPLSPNMPKSTANQAFK